MAEKSDTRDGINAIVLGGILCGVPLVMLKAILGVLGAVHLYFHLSAPFGIGGVISMVYGLALLMVRFLEPERAGHLFLPIVILVIGVGLVAVGNSVSSIGQSSEGSAVALGYFLGRPFLVLGGLACAIGVAFGAARMILLSRRESSGGDAS